MLSPQTTRQSLARANIFVRENALWRLKCSILLSRISERIGCALVDVAVAQRFGVEHEDHVDRVVEEERLVGSGSRAAKLALASSRFGLAAALAALAPADEPRSGVRKAQMVATALKVKPELIANALRLRALSLS